MYTETSHHQLCRTARPSMGLYYSHFPTTKNLIPRGPMVTASGYDVSYFCNQKIPGSSPGGEDFVFWLPRFSMIYLPIYAHGLAIYRVFVVASITRIDC